MCVFSRVAKALETLHEEGRLSKEPAFHVDGICYNGDKEEACQD